MPKGHYDRSVRRYGLSSTEIELRQATAPVERSLPAMIRLTEAYGFIDEIGAVYGPKMAGYETSNPKEIAVLMERGASLIAIVEETP